MPTKKRKSQRAGLKQGRYDGVKKSKGNKENVTVYITALLSDCEDGIDDTFSSLPVRGTQSIPAAMCKAPEAPPLHPYPCADEDNLLPELEPVSDDEDDGEEEIHADDEGGDDLDDFPGGWDNDIYAEAYRNLCVPHPATDSDADPAPPVNIPANDSFRFNYSADLDDEYLEEYGSNDFADSGGQDEDEPMDDEPDADGPAKDDAKEGKFTAPSIDEATAALKVINTLLRPRRNTGAGYKKCDLPLYTHTRLEWTSSFLHLYTSSNRTVPGQPVNSK
ncbi:hypothetical protein B0H14DRAFT_3483148 [Mycena olivaceomarginata]|nr:hypothetical protein B0H14DRAFT_3483148 [Mycena olivaceomarginata]